MEIEHKKNKCLKGKKVAVLVETEYIHQELEAYSTFFKRHGAEVDFMTYLKGEKSRKIICDITNVNNPQENIHTMDVTLDIKDCNPNDYAIVLIAANYVACRLREIMPEGSHGSVEELSTPSAVRFISEAMKNKCIVKGALCHGLWLLTPVPELLKGRNVMCHTVVLADIHNAGANYVPNHGNVVVDDDLVTGRSVNDLEEYLQTILNTYLHIKK